ncbi:MAG: type II toxin-antitoxin system HicB family antitoxin [Dehalococcoidia bacterium]|nr:type II toxin-antitoxin system HicB family antitoxin [Dehalococcoidia bacterium]
MKELLVAIHLEELPEGGYLATSAELPGLVAQGRTVAETLEIAQDVARKLMESYREHGDPFLTSGRLPQHATPNMRIPVILLRC